VYVHPLEDGKRRAADTLEPGASQPVTLGSRARPFRKVTNYPSQSIGVWEGAVVAEKFRVDWEVQTTMHIRSSDELRSPVWIDISAKPGEALHHAVREYGPSNPDAATR